MTSHVYAQSPLRFALVAGTRSLTPWQLDCVHRLEQSGAAVTAVPEPGEGVDFVLDFTGEAASLAPLTRLGVWSLPGTGPSSRLKHDCAAALRRFLEALLYGVSTGDPITWVAGTTLLAAVALIATLIPVSRVLKVDPIAVLRYE